MAREKKKGVGHALRTAADALRRKRTVAAVYVLLRFLVILTMVAQFFNGNYESVFLCLLTLVLFLLPTILERALMVDLPNTLEVIILLFIFSAEILGEISAFYTTFQGWDTSLRGQKSSENLWIWEQIPKKLSGFFGSLPAKIKKEEFQ